MPKSSREVTVQPMVFRELEVRTVRDVTPGMRRVTLTGPQLGAFTSASGHPMAAFRSPGFDDDVRLHFPYPGESEPVLPVQLAHRVAFPADGRRPLARAYTVRRFDPEAAELDVDVVRHGTGVASTWACRTAPGDRIHLGGPLMSKAFPDADWLLVAGDETALPAIARLLDDAPADLRAQVFVEIADDTDRQDLRALPGVTLRWLPRDGAAAGSTALLLDAVRAADEWPGTAFAWVAGEQAVVRDLRRHLVEERGMAKADVEFTGYWRRSAVVPLAGDAAVPDPGTVTSAATRFHDLVELVPPVAVRTAVGLGIGDRISRGVRTAAALAEASGSDPRAMAKLLRYLRTIDLLSEPAPGEYALTEVGEFMAAEYWIDHLHPDGAQGRQELGLTGLTRSVRTGHAAYAAVTGQEHGALGREQWYDDARLEQATRRAAFSAGPLAASPALDDVEHLVVHADAAGLFARELLAARPGIHVTIRARPTQVEWLRRDLPESIPDPDRRARVTVQEGSVLDPAPGADAALLVGALGSLPDADVVGALSAAADGLTGPARVLLMERVLDTDRLDEHDGEADLIGLTRDGIGLRTLAELTPLVEAAGLRIAETRALGWSATLRVLR